MPLRRCGLYFAARTTRHVPSRNHCRRPIGSDHSGRCPSESGKLGPYRCAERQREDTAVTERAVAQVDNQQRRKDRRTEITFDVVRIDPQGSSVFAGQAPPNSSVSILANGRALATAAADETGAWAIVTDRKITPGEHEISLGAVSTQGAVTAGETIQIVVAPPVAGVTSISEPHARSPQSSPAPITFVYNDTAFTADGRRAAESLAKHLISQQPAAVSLSGHADERGTEVYNIELSRRRLLVVADYLRDSGFTGKLELIPKGKSEPYTGIDRRSLPREDAFQLDRRVELYRPRH